jgi:hypothetical protein
MQYLGPADSPNHPPTHPPTHSLAHWCCVAQTLFLYLEALPEDVRDRVWDIYIFEASWKIFFRLGLALLKRTEPSLLQLPIDTLMTYISTFPEVR